MCDSIYILLTIWQAFIKHYGRHIWREGLRDLGKALLGSGTRIGALEWFGLEMGWDWEAMSTYMIPKNVQDRSSFCDREETGSGPTTSFLGPTAEGIVMAFQSRRE